MKCNMKCSVFLLVAGLVVALGNRQAQATISPAVVHKALAGAGAAGDLFGYSVTVSGDTAVIGAKDEGHVGAAYVFVRAGMTGRSRAISLPLTVRTVMHLVAAWPWMPTTRS